MNFAKFADIQTYGRTDGQKKGTSKDSFRVYARDLKNSEFTQVEDPVYYITNDRFILRFLVKEDKKLLPCTFLK